MATIEDLDRLSELCADRAWPLWQVSPEVSELKP